MTKKLFLLGGTMALAVVSAATSYRITLFQPSMLGSNELKAGDYKVELHDSKAVLTRGRDKIEANVKTETSDTKYSSTSVRYSNGSGKYLIQEIRLGGTNTKLVFEN